MIHLVYVSSATSDMSEDDLVELLWQSRARNARQNVTGMLLYVDGNFIQVLEGSAEDVEDIYESIEKDARNSGNIVITKEAIEQRSFPFWTMGFKRLTRSDIDHLPGFSSFLDKRMTAGELAASEKVIGLLYHFKEDNLR